MASPMSLSAGRLRHRIAIQTATETRNNIGGVIQTWATQSTRWGSIEPLSSKELLDAQQIDAIATHKIIIRYYSGLTIRDRLQNDGRIFNILSILNTQERNKVHMILANESI